MSQISSQSFMPTTEVTPSPRRLSAESSSFDPPKEGSRNPNFRSASSIVNLLCFQWDILQRLFSTFADGWPGSGLLILRLLTGTTVIYSSISGIRDGSPPLLMALQTAGIAAGIFLSVGLFTPVAGVL